jgi:hypothetical protein
LEHLQRLQAIERARARGASLTLIATHLAQGRPLDEDTVIGWSSGSQSLDTRGSSASSGSGGTGDDTSVDELAAAPDRSRPAGSPSTVTGPRRRPDRRRTDIGALLAMLDAQRDVAAQAHVEDLVAAGVFERDGFTVMAAPDLADALTALQDHGLPVQTALGVAQHAMRVARPVVQSVDDAVAGLGGAGIAVRSQLGEVAGFVVRQVVARHPEH